MVYLPLKVLTFQVRPEMDGTQKQKEVQVKNIYLFR